MNENKKTSNIKIASIYIILSSLAFAVMQLFVKVTAGKYNVFFQTFMRNIVILILSGIGLLIKGQSFKIETKKKELLYRCIAGFSSVVLYFYATKTLNLADASALHKSSPFFIVILTAIINKRRIDKQSLGIIILAFIGVLLVIKPNFVLAPIPTIAAISGAFLAAVAYIMISFIGKDIDSLLIIFYFSLFSSIVCLILGWNHFVIPQSEDIIPLILIGVGGGLGQLFVTLGYQMTSADKISVFTFTTIAFSAILGYYVYAEKIDTLSFIGIGIIILAAILKHISNNKDSLNKKTASNEA